MPNVSLNSLIVGGKPLESTHLHIASKVSLCRGDILSTFVLPMVSPVFHENKKALTDRDNLIL
jgi:hypothetical protein